MTPDVQKALLEFVQAATSQTPQLVQEVLAYGLLWAQIGIISGMVCVGVAALLLIVAMAKRGENSDTASGCFIVGCFAMAIGLGMIAGNARDYYKIQHAPRLYVVQELRRLM